MGEMSRKMRKGEEVVGRRRRIISIEPLKLQFKLLFALLTIFLATDRLRTNQKGQFGAIEGRYGFCRRLHYSGAPND